MNKMNFTMKTQIFLWIMLVLVVVALGIFFVFSQTLNNDLDDVQNVNFRNAYLALNLLDELGDMQGNALDYMTGEGDERAGFEDNVKEYEGFVNQIVVPQGDSETANTKQELVDMAQTYAGRIRSIFDLYVPENEARAKELADTLLKTTAKDLEALLEVARDAEIADSNNTTDIAESRADDIPGIVQYAELVDEAGDISGDIQRYINGVEGAQESYIKDVESVKKALAILRPLEPTVTDSQRLDQIERYFEEIYSAAQEIFALYNPADKAQALVVLDTVEHEEFAQLEDIVDAFASSKVGLVDQNINKINDNIQFILIILMVILVTAVALTGFSAIMIRRLAVDPIKNITLKMSDSAASITSAAVQFSQSSQQLAEGSNNQAASIEETSASMEETSAMVWQSAENTKVASNLSREAMDAAKTGYGKMDNMKKTMEDLKKSSDDIANIIKVIDNIAFQTNMLALNAAVEAARAGDAGQGFAVVAEEVRNLAQRSAQAAKDTADIIEKNIVRSQQGVSVSEEISISLNEINIKVEKVNNLIAEIAAASDEQSKGVQQVTTAMSTMEKVVQQNAAVAEESASSAQDLRNQSDELEEIVAELNAIVKGAGAPMMRSHRPTVQHKTHTMPVTRSTVRPSSGSGKKLTSYVKKDKDTVVSADQVIPFGDDDDY